MRHAAEIIDGVLPRLDGLGAAERAAQPLAQQPLAERRDAFVERAVKRPGRRAVGRVLEDLEVSQRHAVQNHVLRQCVLVRCHVRLCLLVSRAVHLEHVPRQINIENAEKVGKKY